MGGKTAGHRQREDLGLVGTDLFGVEPSMKAVVLIGGVSKWLYPLSHHRPRGTLRVGNVPPIRYILRHLRAYGVTEFCIPLDKANGSVQDYLKKGDDDSVIHYAYNKRFHGTAGCLNLFRDQLDKEPFLIV